MAIKVGFSIHLIVFVSTLQFQVTKHENAVQYCTIQACGSSSIQIRNRNTLQFNVSVMFKDYFL